MPSLRIGITRSTMPRSSRSICHGTMFEWCSISEMTTSSPGASRARAHPCATRLIDSVVPRVKMTSRADAPPMSARTFSRTPS